MSVINEALKMEPCVGFLVTKPPGRFGPLPAEGVAPDDGATQDCLPGSGITEERREPLPESEPAGDPGLGLSGALVELRAASRTSFKKEFLVVANSVICSSGTVSLFFSKKPSTS